MVDAIPVGSPLLAEDLAQWEDAINDTADDVDDFVNDPPGAQLRATAATSLTNATFTSIAFATEDYDNRGGHSTVTNTSRYTAQVAGRYQLSGGVAWTSNATGTQRAVGWAKNGTPINGAQLAFPVAGGIERQYPARTITVLLAVNDYIELQAYQDSGGALNTSIAAATVQSSMSVLWIGTT